MDTTGPDDRDLLDLALRLADLLVRQQADRATTLGREAKLAAENGALRRDLDDALATVGGLRSEVGTLRAERDEAYRRIAELEDTVTRPAPGPTRDELLDTALQDAEADPLAWRDAVGCPGRWHLIGGAADLPCQKPHGHDGPHGPRED